MKEIRFLNKILIILLSIIFILSPYAASLRSYAIMLPYSYLHHRNSVLSKNNIKFTILGGAYTSKKDWYPFVITFNDDEGLSNYLGEEVEFTVLYNFGHFPLRQGTSSYYNPESPYYSSFYGGYIVKPSTKDRKFGFLDDEKIYAEELSLVPQFDQVHLVLSSLGCPYKQRVFNDNAVSIEYNVDYAGYQDWVRIDSEIETNSPVHQYQGYQQGYLQYGRPLGIFHYEKDFPVITLKGRAYARYFKEYQATFVLYIMAPTWDTVGKCDQDILSKAVISNR